MRWEGRKQSELTHRNPQAIVRPPLHTKKAV